MLNNKNTINFIIEFFNYLNSQNVSYVVLRNFEKLPHFWSHDIDVLINIDRRTYNDLFNRFILNYKNVKLISRSNKFGFTKYIIFGVNFNRNVVIDIFFNSVKFFGHDICNFKPILNNRILKYELFYAPDDTAHASILFIDQLLHTGKISKKYIQLIINNYCLEKENFFKYIFEYFDIKFLRDIIQELEKKNTFEIDLFKFRLRFLINKFVKNPILFAYNLFNYFISSIYYFIKVDRPYIVVFIGPDGSGKTTISKMLFNTLNSQYVKTFYFHSRYELFPEFTPLFGTPAKQISKEKKSKKISKFFTYVVMIYYAFEHLFGYFFKELKYRIITFYSYKPTRFYIFDRYFYDYYIQNPEIELTNVLFQILLKIVKKPDVVFYLSSDSLIIYNRKKDISISNIKQQQQKCVNLFNKYENVIMIHSDNEQNNVLNDVYKYVFKILKNLE